MDADAKPIMDADYKLNSPYVGLVPYSESDAGFFFGRETETEIISANLRSARLTVLYGTSGVGKSSVLQAGVMHNLRQLARQDLKTYGQAEFAVATYRDWAGDPIADIAEAIREAVADSMQIKVEMLEPIPETRNLVKILQAWSNRYSLELLIILDQFEELFNYLSDERPYCAAFAEQLAEAVKAPDLSVRFLISLRGDTLSLLDYFKETIPGLLDNRLQLHSLAASNARRAITKPIHAYNDLYQPEPKFEIEPQLVEEVIRQTRFDPQRGEEAAAEIKAGQVIEDVAKTNDEVQDWAQVYVETPYLQLVMKRIWREEVQVGSNILRLETLTEKLKGASEIIQTHLDEVMQTLTDEERQIASKCFKYLVTPMGTKVALTPEALAKYTEWDEKTIKDTLNLLIKNKESSVNPGVPRALVKRKAATAGQPPDEARVLRAVEIPVGKDRLQGYEVTHDAYIPAILDWRARYVIEHSVINQIKAKTKKALPIAIGILGVIIISFFIWRWSVNSEFYRIAIEAEISNTDRQQLQIENQNLEKKIENESENVIISQIAEKQAKEELKENQNTAYKDLIPILIDLSDSSATERDSAIKKLKKLIGQKKVPKEYERSIIQMVAKIDAQKADDLRNAALNANKSVNPEPQIEPRVYVHIVDESQRAAVRNYKKLLEEKDFTVPGIENVGNIKLTSTQVRYFRRADEPLANQVAELMKSKGIPNMRVQYVSGYEESTAMRPKHLELWFAADAFPGAVVPGAR